jgi:SNF2 family DNA or RNA helicase
VFTGELYPYQEEARERILKRHQLLVAYSMGLGKTPITISATEYLLENGELDGPGRVLIICPASLKWQWAAAIAKFTDTPTETIKLKGTELVVPVKGTCVVIDGKKSERAQLWKYPCDYVICSYQAVLRDWEDSLSKQPFDVVVCDEATALKNFRGKTSKLIKAMQPEYRIALAGAPVENRPEELFSIMQWVDDEVLGRWDYFDKSFIVRNDYGGVRSYKNLDLLHENLRGAMVRKSRRDPDVAPYLPKVTEVDIPVELDAVTRRSYKFIEKELMRALDEMRERGGSFDLAEYYAGGPALSETIRGVVMARMTALHMFLDHPILISESARGYDRDNSGSAYASGLMRNPNFVLSEFSPKLDALEILVEKMLQEDGSKVIIFTQYRRMQRLIESRLKAHWDLQYVLYHGGMTSSEKAMAASRFQDDPHCRIFISTDAGGYGLDLPSANFLVNFDLPYSGGKRVQRNARHVRASSQFKNVYVANLICSETVEVRVKSILSLRERVADSIVDGVGDSVIPNDVDSLTQHVRTH